MKQDWAALKEENEILSKLASHDWLTSIYNRGATETKINQLLAEKKTGVLFVLDVDQFDTATLPEILFFRRSSES